MSGWEVDQSRASEWIPRFASQAVPAETLPDPEEVSVTSQTNPQYCLAGGSGDCELRLGSGAALGAVPETLAELAKTAAAQLRPAGRRQHRSATEERRSGAGGSSV
jgi:hypothetical protein